MPARLHTRIQDAPFDIAAEIEAAHGKNAETGAVVSFTGFVRDLEGTLDALTLEHYPAMTEAEIGRIAEEAARRWPLDAVRIIHRHGRLAPADPIVLVVTASAHRRAAFEAADFLMDWLKTRAPFWKKETRKDGGSNWVAAQEKDDRDAERWLT